jgi:uncharacterized protein YbjT (DUF2867 family)
MDCALVTGAGGGVGGVGRRVVGLLRERDLPVRAFVHRDDDRAEALRALGADVFVGDLARPSAVAEADAMRAVATRALYPESVPR